MNTVNINTDVSYVTWDESQTALMHIIKMVGMKDVSFGQTPLMDTPALIVGNEGVLKGSHVLKTPWGIQTVSAIDMEAFLME